MLSCDGMQRLIQSIAKWKALRILQVTEAVKIAQERRPDLKLEGPLQYDAAVDPEVAKTKVKGEEPGGWPSHSLHLPFSGYGQQHIQGKLSVETFRFPFFLCSNRHADDTGEGKDSCCGT